MITDRPSLIIATFLETEGVFKRPAATNEFSLFINFSPDDIDGLVKDDIGIIYDIAGIKDGRQMEGTNIFHPGLQLSVRSRVQSVGWDKLIEASRALEILSNKEVLVRNGVYTLQNVSATSPLFFLGLEEGTKRRFLFTQNFLATIKEA